jgi:large subunit ribosomal protein L35
LHYRIQLYLPHHAVAIQTWYFAFQWMANNCGRILVSRKNSMPKLKTHKGASKRFKKTGTGKVVRQHAFARHILTSKARKRKNKLHTSVVADDADQAKLQRMIPY